MALDFIPIECPFCDGEARLYDGEAEAICRDCQAAIDVGPRCIVCGCCELAACLGGCVWARENLCSRCALQEAA